MSSNSVELSCPSHPVPEGEGDPIVHVWYYPSSAGIAAPTTRPKVVFRLFKGDPLVVSCATYHLLTYSDVMVKTYTVSKSESHQLHSEAAGSWDGTNRYGQVQGPAAVSEDGGDGGGGPPTVLVVVLATTGTVLGLVLIITILKCVKKTRS